MQKYYDENKYKYNTWDGNNLLKKYVQQYYQGFGRSIAEAAGFLFGKFDGNLEDCLKFFEGYEKNLKINQSFSKKGNKKFNDIGHFFNEYMSKNTKENKYAFLNQFKTDYKNYKKTRESWRTNKDYIKSQDILPKLKPEFISTITQVDMSWNEDEMYSKYLIPIAQLYYKQLHKGQDFDISNYAKDKVCFNAIVEKCDKKQKDLDTWDKSNIEATYISYQNSQQIESKLTWEQFKDKYQTPEKAQIAIDIDKYRKLIKEKLDITDEDLPGQTRFKGYHETEIGSQKRLDWLRRYYTNLTEKFNESWKSGTMLTIYNNFREKYSDDPDYSTIEKTASKYGFDYLTGKTDLNYRYHLALYKEKFNEEYKPSIAPEKNEEKEVIIEDIKKKIQSVDQYNNLNFLLVLQKYNSSAEHQLEVVDIVKNFGKDYSNAIIWLECEKLKNDIIALQPDTAEKVRAITNSITGKQQLQILY